MPGTLHSMATPHPALPSTAYANDEGILIIGGCPVTELARRFGTPLYVYDLASLREALRACRDGLDGAGTAHYACKAYLARWLTALVRAEGLDLDACSESELRMGLAHDFPAARIRLHGNNKPAGALRLAIQAGIGAVVVDNIPELQRLITVAADEGSWAPVLLRLNPGIEAHTHRYLQTGVLDSKFGLPIEGGDAARAVRLALRYPQFITLLGYHAHIGTQILDLEPFRLLMRRLIAFALEVERDSGFWPAQLSPGGGIGITYTDEQPPALADWLAALRAELRALEPARQPRLSVEPGRALVGPAGVALYRVGTIKRVPGGHIYAAVDGGMADNIRPALYGARYAALAATRMHQAPTQLLTIAGPYCESGDILVHDAELPAMEPGDLIALPASGAYCLPMSSNYNGALRPAVVLVHEGTMRPVQRRQTVEDLLALDV
ncbi:MAG TPA: diaminopimelate decarboxylase [Chloroflexota bacterium]|nr:diaminopimelate decarboxylase [Chloroflexota bacterium]